MPINATVPVIASCNNPKELGSPLSKGHLQLHTYTYRSSVKTIYHVHVDRPSSTSV